VIDVYLVRHGIAEDRDSARWPDDGERPLTAKGAARFRSAARGLGQFVPAVDAVYSSPYTRAWQTAEVLQTEIDWPAARPCPELAPLRPPGDLLPVLRRLRPPISVAFVGHEPHLSSLASLLAAGDEDGLRLELKKGAVALLSVESPPAPGAALLRWSASPKILRSIDATAR
jgi:phosphohistidine phosphatase